MVLGSDIGAGLVYAIDIYTMKDEIMMAPTSLPGYEINAIKTHGEYLYFVNIGKGLISAAYRWI